MKIRHLHVREYFNMGIKRSTLHFPPIQCRPEGAFAKVDVLRLFNSLDMTSVELDS